MITMFASKSRGAGFESSTPTTAVRISRLENGWMDAKSKFVIIAYLTFRIETQLIIFYKVL